MNAIVAPAAAPTRFPYDHPLRWLLLMAAGHVLMRLLASPAVKWDEAEQVLWSQQLAWGYGAQPPLYTWLQWGVNQLLGPSVLSLSLLKHGLMALAYVFMYLAGRELLGPRGAWWAAAALLLMPPFGWYSVRDQTHTVLVTTATCAAWWLLLRIVRRPRQSDFAWLGAACAVGMLSKYSFALVAGAMLAAALSVPKARRALLARGWWWALIVGVLLVLPHGLWLLSHLHDATAGTLSKMEIRAHHLGSGLYELLDGLVGTLLLWALVALWAFGRGWWRKPLVPAAPWAQQVFVRYLALVLLALLGMVLFAGVTNFKGRWIIPLLCVLPLAAFAARPELQADARGGRRYLGAVLTVALLALAMAGLRPWVSNLRGGTDELNQPAYALAGQLRAHGYDGRSPIIASDHMLAGTLRLRFPRAPVMACHPSVTDVPTCVRNAVAAAEQQGQGWLLISRSDRLEPGWWDLARAAIAGQAVQSVEMPFSKVSASTPPAHYDFIWQAPKAGS